MPGSHCSSTYLNIHSQLRNRITQKAFKSNWAWHQCKSELMFLNSMNRPMITYSLSGWSSTCVCQEEIAQTPLPCRPPLCHFWNETRESWFMNYCLDLFLTLPHFIIHSSIFKYFWLKGIWRNWWSKRKSSFKKLFKTLKINFKSSQNRFQILL